MSKGMDIKVKTEGLERLIKAFKGNLPYARVGILGDAKPRTQAPAEVTHESLMRRATDKQGAKKSKEQWTNAQIGARWEFDPKYKRSFLRVPIMDHLNVRLARAGAFNPDMINEVIRLGSLTPYVGKIGMAALGITLDAFETGGFGKWVPSNMKRKKVKKTLVETQQLMRAQTMDLVEKK